MIETISGLLEEKINKIANILARVISKVEEIIKLILEMKGISLQIVQTLKR